MKNRTRMAPDTRRLQLIEAGLAVAEHVGFVGMTREQVAGAAEVSPALINQYFDGFEAFKSDVMRLAILQESLQVVAAGIVTGHPTALRADENVKRRALGASV